MAQKNAISNFAENLELAIKQMKGKVNNKYQNYERYVYFTIWRLLEEEFRKEGRGAGVTLASRLNNSLAVAPLYIYIYICRAVSDI